VGSHAIIAALVALTVSTGCDNVACVFGPGNCASGSGGSTSGVGTNPASIPLDGRWIGPAAPKVTSMLPTGTSVARTSPIAVIFNESIVDDHLDEAFELQLAGAPPFQVGNVALAGDGRMALVFPQAQLTPSTEYKLLFREGALVVDHVGRALALPSDRTIGQFTTAATDPVAPAVVGSWPPTGTADQSTTTEAVIVFDRPMNSSSFTSTSFVVTVGGTAPPFNPLPIPVQASVTGTDTRAFVWRSVDAQQLPVSLGTSQQVQFNLSPAGHSIHDAQNQSLPASQVSFATAAFSTPLAASISSIPNDAIGINGISGPADLAIKVDLSGSQSGDFVSFYIFGKSQGAAASAPLLALFREVQMTLGPPPLSFTLTAGEIDLLQSSSPLKARFADGELTFAFQVRRGLVQSPLRLLDVDPIAKGAQNPVLDTVAPQLQGLGPSGNVVASFDSDLRDVTLVGRATELLRGALVSTTSPDSDNTTTMGEIPAVTGTGPGGMFVAAPVKLGIVDPASLPLHYSITVYDRALNASGTASGVFTQLGASGPGNPLPGVSVDVSVFDATTLAPISGAEVQTYSFDAGFVDPLELVVTDVNGRATVAASPGAGTETIVNVIATGYDLFTFDGVPTTRLGVPLTPASSSASAATASGTVSTPGGTLSTISKSVADSRVPEIGGALLGVGTCSDDPVSDGSNCPFGPGSIRPHRLGAQAALAVIVPASPLQFAPATFLKGYQPSLPLAPAGASGISGNTIAFETTLDDPLLDPTELPVDGAPSTTLSLVNYPVLDPLQSEPFIAIEAKTPGIPGALTVGLGVAYASVPPTLDWTVRAAYAGAAEPINAPPLHTLGRLAKQGTVEAPLMLRAEVVDPDGNVGGVRLRLPVSSAMLVPLAAAQFIAVGRNPGLLADDLSFGDVLPDAAGEPGIYRVTLTDSTGLRWTIYRSDPPDSAGTDVTVHLAYTGLGNAWPLAPGAVQCQISTYAWPGFDVASFLWSDIERERDLYSHSAPTTIPSLP
jgi:hypothetical protein